MPSKRDTRIDFARGLALLIIFTDHVRGNPLSSFTPVSLSYTSMAEVFIFLSGYVCGLTYRRTLTDQGFYSCQRKALRRSMQIYGAHIATSLLVMSVLLIWAKLVDPLDVSMFASFATFQADMWQFIANVCVLKQKVSDFDILPIYLSLLPVLPAMLYLETCNKIVLPLISIVTYMFVTVAGMHFQWPWVFNPLAWQLLFVFGISLSRLRGKKKLRFKYSAAAVVTSFVLLESLVFAKYMTSDSLPFSSRPNLEPIRVIHFLCFAILIRHVFQQFDFSALRCARPVLLCGRNSLITYCAGAVMANLFTLAGNRFSCNWFWPVVVNVIGWLGCVGVAWGYERSSMGLRGTRGIRKKAK